MIRFRFFVLTLAALLLWWNPSPAQEKAWQTEVLQKLGGIENRMSGVENRLDTIENQLNEMDKRYEIRFTKIETTLDERFGRVEDKIVAVNQRIDDKFNLIVGLLVLVAAFLSVPSISKLFDRFKPSPESKAVSEQLREMREEINQIKSQLAQRAGAST